MPDWPAIVCSLQYIITARLCRAPALTNLHSALCASQEAIANQGIVIGINYDRFAASRLSLTDISARVNPFRLLIDG